MRATKVNAGLTESNGKLLLGVWRDSLRVTCGLTACTPGSAPGPTLGNEYGKTLPFYHIFTPPSTGERSIAMSVSVCLSVRDHIVETTRPSSPVFFCMLPMAVARSSSGGVVIRYVLPVLWTTSYLLISQGCQLKRSAYAALGLAISVALSRRRPVGRSLRGYVYLVAI